MSNESFTEYKRGNGHANGFANGHSGSTFETSEPARPRVRLQAGASIKAVAIKWLWPGWIAAGKFEVVGGGAGVGKTTLVMSMVATVTTGGRWPDGTVSPCGCVVIWSGEDDPADTLVPRLAASGADLSKVFFVTDVEDRGKSRAFDPSKDMDALRESLRELPNVHMIVVDPIVAAVGGDSHKNAETRRGLAPLVDLAGSINAALIGITHFSKGTAGREPLERITGSLAFGALARVVMIAAKDQDEEDGSEGRRFLARAKSNIGPDEGGFAYRLEQRPMPTDPDIIASVAEFGERIDGSARDMLATAETDPEDGNGPGGAMDEAKCFLIDALADGPVPVKKLQGLARDAAQNWSTIKRAKKDLRIETHKGGMDAGWTWQMPEEDQKSPKGITTKAWSSSENVGPLREDDGGTNL